MTRRPARSGWWHRSGASVVMVMTAVGMVACGPGHDEFDQHTIGALTAAVEHRGLEVCSTSTNSNGFANQATATRILFVAIDCHDEVVTLIVDAFANSDDRDAAARNFESQQRPHADGVVWTWGQFTIEATAGRDDAIMERLMPTLDRIGAK